MHISFQEGLNAIPSTATAVGPNLYATMPTQTGPQGPLRPGMQPLMDDLRGGSMPPRMDGPKRKAPHKFQVGSLLPPGVMIEPGSTTTTDTATDYSSSDQGASEQYYAGNRVLRPTSAYQPSSVGSSLGGAPDLNVFMVNPSSLEFQQWQYQQFLQEQQRTYYRDYQQEDPRSEMPQQKPELKKQSSQSEESRDDSLSPPKADKKKSKLLHGDKSFKRMSFNTALSTKATAEEDIPAQETIQEETEDEKSSSMDITRSNSVVTVKESPNISAARRLTAFQPPPYTSQSKTSLPPAMPIMSVVPHLPPLPGSPEQRRRSLLSRHMSFDAMTMPLVNGPVHPGQSSSRSSTSTVSEMTPPMENHLSGASSIDSNTVFAAQLAAGERAVANDIAALHSALLSVNPRPTDAIKDVNQDRRGTLPNPKLMTKMTKGQNMQIQSPGTDKTSYLKHNGIR